jgi:hypothetical protein
MPGKISGQSPEERLGRLRETAAGARAQKRLRRAKRGAVWFSAVGLVAAAAVGALLYPRVDVQVRFTALQADSHKMLDVGHLNYLGPITLKKRAPSGA